MNELLASLFATYDPTVSTVWDRILIVIAIIFFILLITKAGR